MTSRPLPSEPEILAFIARCTEIAPDEAWEGPPDHQRRVYDELCSALRHPRPEAIDVDDIDIPAGSHEIAVRRYLPGTPHPLPALLYFHGGGFVVGGLDSHDDICAELAHRTDAAVIAVDYRLCPEHPYPAAIDDGLTVLAELRRDPCAYGADAGRIVLAGDSAGGMISAAMALRLRDGAGPQVQGLGLLYPALGGDDTKGSYVEQADAPFCTTASIRLYRALYEGGVPRDDDPYCNPLAAAALAGLPPVFISAAHFDPLRDDAKHFARRLEADGGVVEERIEPQMIHGWLRARHSSPGANAAWNAFCAAMGRLLAGQNDARRCQEPIALL